MTADRVPLVSVVMTAFNREKYVAEAIESILAQTFTDFEFIIVDDGSQDGSVEIIREYEKKDDRIRLLALEHNVGNGPAKRHGVEVAQGEFYTGMDDDDVSLPERLQKQVDYLRANPGIGALGACGLVTDQDLKPYSAYNVPERHAHIAYNIFMGRCVIGSSLMIRRDILNAIGGYELSRKRGNDIEMVSRLICRTRFANLPDRLYLYRKHDGQHPWAKAMRDWADLLARLLFRLWGEAPPASLDRFDRVSRGWEKLNWLERRRAKRDIKRLIESMIAANWIEEADRAYLIDLMNMQLEKTSPRLWQMYCHWRRHRFGEIDREEEVH